MIQVAEVEVDAFGPEHAYALAEERDDLEWHDGAQVGESSSYSVEEVK